MPLLPSYRSQSIDLLCKSTDWFLYEGDTGTWWFNKTQLTNSDFPKNSVNSSKFGLNSIRLFASKVWQMVPMTMKNLKGVEDFKNKIGIWKHDWSDCKFYKDFVSSLGYVNLVWQWDISFAVRIRKFGLISSARKCLAFRHLPAWSRHGKTAADCEIYAGLTMMATGQCQWCRCGVCIVGFRPISSALLVFLLLILSG